MQFFSSFRKSLEIVAMFCSTRVSLERSFVTPGRRIFLFFLACTLALTQFSTLAGADQPNLMYANVKAVALDVQVFSENETLRPKSPDFWWRARAADIAKRELGEFASDVAVIDMFAERRYAKFRKEDVFNVQIKVTVNEKAEGLLAGALSLVTYRYFDWRNVCELRFDHASPISFVLNAASKTLRDDLFEVIADSIKLQVTNPIVGYLRQYPNE